MGKANAIGAASTGTGRKFVLCAGRDVSARRRTCRLMSLLLVAVAFVVMIGEQSATGAATVQSTCSNSAFRTGLSAQLPDCRVYEQVSPAEKNGAAAVTPGNPAQSSPDGEMLADMNFFGAYSGGQSASFPAAYLARRTAKGWETTNLSPSTPDPTPPGADDVTYVFSEDMAQVITTLPQQVLAEEATPEVFNLFMSSTTAARTYSWINNSRPAKKPPEGCLPIILAGCFQLVDVVAPAGVASDFRHVLFESDANVLEGAPENLNESIYEGGTWHVSLAGILPDGTTPAGGSTAGSGSNVFYKTGNNTADNRVMNAISSDGSRVIFQAKADEGIPDPAQNGLTEVYDRINGNETIELSAPAVGAAPELTAAGEAMFWAASADGTHVFFTSSAELTTLSYTGATEPKGSDLYEYDLETKKLRDLTVDREPADAEEGAGVQGVVGVSADGSYVYFVAKGQLVPGRGVDHADNLYMVHNEGAPVYIGTLSESDVNDWTPTSTLLESYVTPDGHHLAFTSVESLRTVNFPDGYDNVNQTTQTAEREVYEYSAPSAEEEGEGFTGSVACASCDPSGAAPLGAGLLGSVDRGESRGVAGATSSAFHQARVVSDNGTRVFFTSKDPLAGSMNGNNLAKVYEYEQDGEGSCQTVGGCVYLISSSSSNEEAFFLEADSKGDNVFFATSSELAASDHDSLVDVYDARIGGGLASTPEEVSCGTSCKGRASEPPPVLAPLSVSAGISGNRVAPVGGKQSTAQRRSRKLARALRACRKKRRMRQRQLCEARARKRFGRSAKRRGR